MMNMMQLMNYLENYRIVVLEFEIVKIRVHLLVYMNLCIQVNNCY